MALLQESDSGMEMRLLVEIPGGGRVKAVELSYTGAVPGTLIETALREFFGLPQQRWGVDGQALTGLCAGSPPLTSGAHLTALEGNLPYSPAAPGTHLLTVEVLHGPDARTVFPLSRGRWSLGRNGAELPINDPSIAPVEGVLDIEHSGVHFTARGTCEPLEVGVPFKVGNSVLRVSQPHTGQEGFSPLPESEVDVPAIRPKLLQIAMITLPLLIGLTIALLTGLWLILAMAVGSSLLMALHAFSSGGETRKTRALIAQAAEADLNNARSFGAAAQGRTLVLGQHTRLARVQGKNRELEARPWVDAAPFVLAPADIKDRLGSLPPATQRLVLVYLLETHEQVDILLTPEDSPHYRHLVEPLLAHPRALPVFDPATVCSAALIAQSALAQEAPATEIYLLTAGGHPKDEKPAVASGAQLDGISETTYRRMLRAAVSSAEAGGAGATSTPATRTSDIPFFSSPSIEPRPPAGDIYFYAGANPQTGEALTYGLNTHGPHFLCAGTTGAGKSQFLRSVLWSMALAAPASRLSFILVDFKGGAGLGPLARLPHCVASITDLDVSHLARTLKYLRADLRNRERAFQRAGVSSHTDYQEHCRATGRELDFPQVVICIDEFKMLVDQHPGIMNELMRIAAVGRSLGYHLFLATQRPQGAVSPEIRANIATAFCLRVSSTQDSYNVISAEDAAQIPAHAPGLGYAKDSENRLLQFQAPLIDGTYSATEPRVLSLHCLSEPQENTARLAGGGALTDKEFTELCARAQKGSAPPRYLPIAPSLAPVPWQTGGHPLALEIGYLEVPDIGVQERWVWQETEGSLLCVGTPGERTEHLLMLMGQALSRGCQVLSFSPSEQFVHRVRAEFEQTGLPCYAYSLRDFDFMRGLLKVLGESPAPVFLVLDGFEAIQDSLARYPDLEAQLLDLLAPIGSSMVKTLCTAVTLPRGKFHHIFEHVLFSASYLEHDPLKSHIKDYNRPPANQFAVEGQAVRKLAGDITENGTVCWAPGAKLPEAVPETGKKGSALKQLPEGLEAADLPELPQGILPFVGLTRDGSPALLPELRNGFISVAGKKGSGKTSFLRALREYNAHLPSIFLPGEGKITVEQLESALDRSQAKSNQLPLLCVDNLHLLSCEVQNYILGAKSRFLAVILTYTPWPRWNSSPILSALSGTETGIVLAPDSLADLSFYPGATLPWDLRTDGRVPAGRAVVIEHGESLAIQVPLPAGH